MNKPKRVTVRVILAVVTGLLYCAAGIWMASDLSLTRILIGLGCMVSTSIALLLVERAIDKRQVGP